MAKPVIDEWQREIRRAQDADTLLAVVRQFLGSLGSDQLARLPRSSQPHAMRDIEDLAALNVQVTKEELMFSGDEETRAVLRRMVTVLTEATNRLAQLSPEARTLRQ